MRKTYLDNIRWITVVLVVFYHVIFMYNSVQTSLVIGPFAAVQYQDIYLYLVYPWVMLLLFTVAGMSARFYLEKHSGREFIKARTVKLLVPSTIGLFVFQWIQGYYSMAITNAFVSIPKGVPVIVRYFIMALSGQGVLWFAQLLWFFSLVLLLIRKVEKDRLYHLCGKAGILVLLLLTVLVYGAAQILNVPLVEVYRVGIYLFGYLTGYYVLSHDEVMERLSKWWLSLVIIATALAILFIWIYFGQDYTAHAVLDSPLCNAFAWITILAIFAVMNRYGNFETAFSKWMKQKAWGLYVFHYLVISAVAYYLHSYCSGYPAIIIYRITAVAAFMGAFVLHALISRIPVIRWCILGIRRVKKDSNQIK